LLAYSKSAGSDLRALAANLPASDGVVVMDMRRIVNDELPGLLSRGGRMQLLNDLNAQIDAVKNQTGINLRNFEHVAVGVRFKETAPGKLDYEPLALARGNAELKADMLLAAAKIASKGKYREEKVGGKTVYIFAAKEIFIAGKPTGSTQQQEEEFNRTLARIPEEVAVAAFDANTLAVGAPARVAETLEGRNRVSENLLALVERKPGAILAFGAKLPEGASRFFRLDNDEIGKNIDSIEQASGAVDMVAGNAVVSIAAKTYQPEQAKDLQDMLEFLRSIGTSFLGASQGADQKIYARLVESAKIDRAGSEVTLDVQIPGSDLSQLLGKK
jgi:hypothetical protein